MNNIQEQALQVLSLTRGQCDQAEVFVVRSRSTPVSYENNRLKMVETVESQAYALRVIKGGHVGFATSTKPGGAASLVENALAATNFGPPAEIDFSGPSPVPPVDCHDPAVPSLALDRMVAMGEDLLESARQLDPQIMAGAKVSKSEYEAAIATSAGLDASYQKTSFGLFVSIEYIEGQNLLYVWDGYGGTHFEDQLAQVKAKVAHDFRLGRKNVPMDTGSYDVIIAPGAVGDILNPILTCVNGRAVERGISPWRGRLGEAMFSPKFSLYDDGLAPKMSSTGAFDGEGVPMSRKPVIEAGRLANYLLDLRAAKALGLKPTGNAARRSGLSAPEPSSTNIIVSPGDVGLADMIKGVKKGVLVEQLMGAWAGNMYAGQVSGNIALGFKIENGEPVGRVKDCMLSINAFSALKDNLEALSKETRAVMDLSTPHFLISNASISTKA